MKIGIYGAGSWGTALASLCVSNGKDTILIARDKTTVDEINTKNTNTRYLPDASLPEGLTASDDIGNLVSCDVVLSAIPAQSFSSVVSHLSESMSPNSHLILCSKGIDREHNKFLSELAQDYFAQSRISVLSGPSFAEDIVRGLPSAVSLASYDLSTSESLSNLLASSTFRPYAGDDVRGVEAGGALKNVYAICVGIARGLELGSSSEAGLLTRSFSELQDLVVAFGGRKDTVFGLSGLGDLLLTSSSLQSRNFSYGVCVGRGEAHSDKLVEGVATSQIALVKSKDCGLSSPILSSLNEVLSREISPRDAVIQLLGRPLNVE